MRKRDRPQFFDLPRDEAIALLARHNIGRLAFSFHDHVDIEPISYVYGGDGWIYARTSLGTKLTALQHHPWVAFEVDEVKHRLHWQSVVVRGAIYCVEPERSEKDRAEYEAALERLRNIDPDALAPSDDTPHRATVLRMHIDEIVGRGATAH